MIFKPWCNIIYFASRHVCQFPPRHEKGQGATSRQKTLLGFLSVYFWFLKVLLKSRSLGISLKVTDQ